MSSCTSSSYDYYDGHNPFVYFQHGDIAGGLFTTLEDVVVFLGIPFIVLFLVAGISYSAYCAISSLVRSVRSRLPRHTPTMPTGSV